MSDSKIRSWKILAMGRSKPGAPRIEKHLHERGYTIITRIGVENNKASDDYLIELLKGNDWDGISVGMC